MTRLGRLIDGIVARATAAASWLVLPIAPLGRFFHGRSNHGR
jgi:hypothetical protein